MYNHQLDAFVKAAELGSFAKAAEAMYISSPALLQQINLLEARCGFKLFLRSNHGVKLTAAGKSLYEDAKTIIRLSNDALEKAARLAELSQNTVRVATSLLFKCRLLPDIWAKISEKCPDLKIEILPIPEKQSQIDSVQEIGQRYDIREGIYCDTVLDGTCQFLELQKTRFCCAVAKNHRLANAKRLTMEELNGEYLVMPIVGVSSEMDQFRTEIQQGHPTIHIIDSPYYGVDTFTLCEMNPYVLISQEVYADIHPDLVTIPLETQHTLPYGLMYANEPTPATKQFIQSIKKI